MLEWFRDALWWLVDSILDVVYTWPALLLDWLLALCLDAFDRLLAWADLLLPSELVSSFDAIPWASMSPYLDAVTWLFPIDSMLGIAFAAYATAGALRLIRWVLAFVPTIGG